MGSFVKVAQFSLSELDETWKDMKQKVKFDLQLITYCLNLLAFSAVLLIASLHSIYSVVDSE